MNGECQDHWVRIDLISRHHSDCFALVDIEDVDMVSGIRWYRLDNNGRIYAQARRHIDGRKRTVLMHRLILGVAATGRPFVDHINHDGLDNRRANLRLVSHQQNMFNMRSHQHGSSRFKGVHWDVERSRWVASYRLNGKPHKIGRFRSEEEAANAYDEMVRKAFGDHAYLNFPT